MIELVGNHLWQSTVFLAAAGLLTLALRTNRAQVRYWVWLAASVKFLIPFAALIAIGGEFGWGPASSIVLPEMTLAIDAMTEPFSRPELRAAAPSASSTGATALPKILGLMWLCGCAVVVVTWWRRWRRVAATARAARLVTSGRELDALRRAQRIAGAPRLALVSSDTLLEPGVFGIVKPVLLWPRGIAGHLNDSQVEALLAHELAHVRRRDNLTAAVHMVVEATFWFHPLVWWLGARLVDERERACDEDVIRFGTDPQVYAESILTTCKFCLDSPLACVAGITGSDLKHRIERIMTNHPPRQLNFYRRLLLLAAAVVAIAGPIAHGAVKAPRLGAESQATNTNDLTFAEAAVTPTSDRGFYRHTMGADGRFTWASVTLRGLIRTAYRGQDFAQMAGVPSWADSERFAVDAKASFNATEEQTWSMVRSLLADRFRLRTHVETREVPVYALVLAGGTLGPRIRPTACAAKETVTLPPGPLDPKRPPIPLPCGGIRSGKGNLQARFATMAELAPALGMHVGRPVRDRTGRTERFDLEVEWTPAAEHVPPAAPGIGPATFAAIEEQLGLRLDPHIGPVGVLVIDHVERPAPQPQR